MSNYLTIDVGGTNIKYALMNDNVEVIEKGEVPVLQTAPEEPLTLGTEEEVP